MLGDTPKARKRRKRVAGVSTRGRLWKHSTLADLDGLITPADLDALFVFTLVRNPWDRMVSYYHWLRGQGFDHPAVELAGRLSFGDFAAHPQTLTGLRAAPARHYMTDAAGREKCDLYIRLEHFEEDSRPLWDHLGFTLDLPETNASERHADYRLYYTEAVRTAVGQAAAEDIARFGYVF